MKLSKKSLRKLILAEAIKIAEAGDPAMSVSSRAAELGLVSDPEHWASMGVDSVADLEHYLAAEDHSYLWKAVYGHRPRHINYKAMATDEILDEIDALLGSLKDKEDEDRDWYRYELEHGEHESIPQVGKGARKWDISDLPDIESQFEMMPKHRGMRHTESRTFSIKKSDIRQIIREELSRVAKMGNVLREFGGGEVGFMDELDEKPPEGAESKAPKKWWDETHAAVKKSTGLSDDKRVSAIVGDLWDNRMDDDSRKEVREKFGESDAY